MGKEGAQIGHAVLAFLGRQFEANLKARPFKKDRNVPTYITIPVNEALAAWFVDSYRKVVVVANDEAELLEIYERAKAAGLEAHLITDSGYTCFEEPTNTAVGIGPDFADKIDPITGHLKLR
jgi:peptidyl-tRNA hydrolase